MAHSNWLYQTRDIMFQIKEWLGVEKLLSLDAYKDYYGMDDINSFLDVNFKVCRDVMCPANKDADEPGAKFVGGNEHAVVIRLLRPVSSPFFPNMSQEKI